MHKIVVGEAVIGEWFNGLATFKFCDEQVVCGADESLIVGLKLLKEFLDKLGARDVFCEAEPVMVLTSYYDRHAKVDVYEWTAATYRVADDVFEAEKRIISRQMALLVLAQPRSWLTNPSGLGCTGE